MLVVYLSGCSKHDVKQSGESYTYVVVRLEYLSEIRQLCIDANPASGFTNEETMIATRARCVLANMNPFNISTEITDEFSNEFCKEDADLSHLSDEERANVVKACQILGGL